MFGDVCADDGEVTILHFPDVRAAVGGTTGQDSFVLVGADASSEHDLLVPIGTYQVKWNLRYVWWVSKLKPDAIGSSVVRLIRERREALGLSMNEVASRAGLSHTMISRVERELRRPTLDTLLRITGAMKIDLWPLLKKAESQETVHK